MPINYRDFHIQLLKQTYNQLLRLPPFASELLGDQDAAFLEQMQQLVEDLEAQELHAHDEGQNLITRFIRAYPDLVPIMPRDLLWFFGGDCLHFMPDDEVEKFQRLDEKMHDSSADSPFDYARERAVIFDLAH